MAPTDQQRRLSPGTWRWEGGAGGGTQTSPLCPSHFRQHRNRSCGPAGRKPSSGPKGEFQNFLHRLVLLFSKYIWELPLLRKGTFRREKSAPERSEIKGLFLRSLLHTCFRSPYFPPRGLSTSFRSWPASWAPLEFGVKFSAPADTSYR